MNLQTYEWYNTLIGEANDRFWELRKQSRRKVVFTSNLGAPYQRPAVKPLFRPTELLPNCYRTSRKCYLKETGGIEGTTNRVTH